MLRVAIFLLVCLIVQSFAKTLRSKAVKSERLQILPRYVLDFRKVVRQKSPVSQIANSTVECALLFQSRIKPSPQEGFIFNRKTLACALVLDPVGPGRFVDAAWMEALSHDQVVPEPR